MQKEGLKNPFVLQCRVCKEIIADSFNLLSARDSFLIFGRAAGTVREAEPVPGKDAFADCSLSELHCPCGANVGFRLISSNVDWNGHASHYFLTKETMKSYVLGEEVLEDKNFYELIEDVEKLKCVVAKIYKKVFQ